MSNSSLSDNAPDDTVLEEELRQVVARIYRSEDTDELTVNGVRNTAQDNLGLRKGFFKEAEWKERSKAIIEEEAEKRNNPSEAGPKSSPAKPPVKSSKAAKSPKKRSSSEDASEPKPKKRRTLTKARQSGDKKKEKEEVDEESDKDVAMSNNKNSRRKQIADESSGLSDIGHTESESDHAVKKPKVFEETTAIGSDGDLSELEDDAPKRKKKRSSRAKKKIESEDSEGVNSDSKPIDNASESELSELSDEASQPMQSKKSSKKIKEDASPKKTNKNSIQRKSEVTADDKVAGSAAIQTCEASESELSVLTDDDPKPKRRKKGSKEPKPKSEPKKRGRKSAPKPDLDPDAEEIKRLQGWLVKCGMRKMWARELKPYDTAKEKVRHLKGLLSDVGMTGRFSVEKAARIREMRELQADLMAVQEGEKRWGKRDGEEEEKPKRVSRGLPNIDDFGSESE